MSLLFSLLPLRTWLLIGVISAGLAYHWHAVSSSYREGHAAASADCRAADIQAELDAARVDLAAAQAAAEAMREAAEESRRVTEDNQKRVEEYEAALRARGDDARCRLGDDDVRWLRENGSGGRARPPLPPARP
jgi:hypothetical protein